MGLRSLSKSYRWLTNILITEFKLQQQPQKTLYTEIAIVTQVFGHNLLDSRTCGP